MKRYLKIYCSLLIIVLSQTSIACTSYQRFIEEEGHQFNQKYQLQFLPHSSTFLIDELSARSTIDIRQYFKDKSKDIDRECLILQTVEQMHYDVCTLKPNAFKDEVWILNYLDINKFSCNLVKHPDFSDLIQDLYYLVFRRDLSIFLSHKYIISYASIAHIFICLNKNTTQAYLDNSSLDCYKHLKNLQAQKFEHMQQTDQFHHQIIDIHKRLVSMQQLISQIE